MVRLQKQLTLTSDCGLLHSGNDLIQAFEGVVLRLLSAGHGAMDSHFLSVDVAE